MNLVYPDAGDLRAGDDAAAQRVLRRSTSSSAPAPARRSCSPPHRAEHADALPDDGADAEAEPTGRTRRLARRRSLSYGREHATYVGGSGTPSLVFEYLTFADQDTGGEPVRLPRADNTEVWNATSTQILTPGGAAAWRRAATPTTKILRDVNASSVVAARVVLNKDRPKVNVTPGSGR